MAKSKKSNQTDIQKSLDAAAKLLNRSFHAPALNATEREAKPDLEAADKPLFAVTMHQAFCEDEDRSLGSPTTDVNLARHAAQIHRQLTGHVSRVISSK